MMKKFFLLSCSIFLISLWGLSLSTGASGDTWTKTGGPIGGLGYDVRIDLTDTNTMFVTDNWSGVNKSTNAGATWSTSNSGIDISSGSSSDAVPIFSLTIDPNDSNRVWAGTQGEETDFGVYRSDDGGSNWVKKVTGMTLEGGDGLVFRGFTIEEGNSNVVYAMAEVPTVEQGKEFNKTKGRIYKTTDTGDNWTKIWDGDSLARYLIIDPSDSETLYASTGIFDREAYNSDCSSGTPGGVGVLRSTDGGSTWSQVNTGLTDLYVGALRMHPTNSSILFAATGNNACSSDSGSDLISGLFKTTNGGASWTKVISKDIMTTVNFSLSNTDIVYAGSASAFYRSEDGGDNWDTYEREEGVWGPPGVRAGVPIDVTVDPDDPYTLYVNNYGGGVLKSTDGGETWSSWSKGYTGAEIHNLDVDPENDATVYAIGRSGPFKSTNGGDNWTGIANGDAANIPEWYSIKQKPDDSSIILIADEHQGRIFRSTDSGNYFKEVLMHPSADDSDPNGRQGFKALTFSLSHQNVVYAGLAQDRNLLDTSSPAGTAIYKSTDAGSTWSAKTSMIDGTSINALAVHPTDPNTVYATTTKGVYKTTDGADNWSSLSDLSDRDIRSLAIDPSSPDILYAGEEKGGVWKSSDGGSSWTGPKNTGFSSANPSIRRLAIDPTNTSVVYAGDWSSGVYQSTDGGETWSAFPDSSMSGLTMRSIKDLIISSDGGVIYAATQGEGVFRYGTPTGSDTSNGDGDGDSGGGCTLRPHLAP